MTAAAPRSCGSCTLCCKLLGIPELDKPPGTWCGFCKVGSGCQVYENRPQNCRGWSCMWLADPDRMLPDDLRPDRCKVIFDHQQSDGRPALVVHVEPQNRGALERPAIRAVIEAALAGDVNVLVISGRERKLLPGKGANGVWAIRRGKVTS